MSDTVEKALEDVYTALHANNAGIDKAIAALKTALEAKGEKVAVFAKERLAQNDRQGRRMMQSYFKKRGVTVEFSEGEKKSA